MTSSPAPVAGTTRLGHGARPVRRRRGRVSGDTGMATAELAVCLPGLALLVVFGVGALAVVRDHIYCVAAAREVAIAAARGEAPPPVDVAVVEISNDGDVVRVVVSRHRPFGPLPGIEVTATAVAAVEPVS